MSRIVGIDIRQSTIQAAVLRTSYRRTFLERLQEVDRTQHASLIDALAELAARVNLHGESIAVAISGDAAYIHRLQLPPAALKQVEEVVPFELEAQIPVDFEQLVFDSRVLPRGKDDEKVDVIAAAAQTVLVRKRIEETAEGLKHEPERVGVGPLPIANLASVCPELDGPEYRAVLDLGEDTSEFVIIHQRVAVYARTLSIGVSGLPDSAPDMVRALRQTLVSWSTVSQQPVEVVYLCGGGAEAVGIAEYLAAYLKLTVQRLPELKELSLPEGWSEIEKRDVARFGKAIALGLSLRTGSKDLNLRQGELRYERGYGFLKERIPLLAGLAAMTLLSFLFSAWAQSRTLEREYTDLSKAMSLLSEQILHEETEDVDRVVELLDQGTKQEKDPQPELDGFELAMTLAEKIPKDFEHDVAELDLQRGHVNLRGVVKSTDQAQKIVEALKEKPCFKDVKISQIAQEMKTDRQKYSMEFEMRCEEPPKKNASPEGEEG
ncbi:MAG TPA: pilus assembly protein PilM [Polyangiaceae bacterium]|jgi:general secretion pathway protein L|nr:pilus assembly protein PilM [Polyangiaceae bacterium]